MAHPNNRVYFLPSYNQLDWFWDYFYGREKVNLDDYMFTRRIDRSRKLDGWTDSRGVDTYAGFLWRVIL
jgi:hypothetical protein